MRGKKIPYCPVSLRVSHSLVNKFKSVNYRASLVAQTVKNLPALRETRDGSLGGENPLEKGMATHSCLRIPWTEEPVSRSVL